MSLTEWIDAHGLASLFPRSAERLGCNPVPRLGSGGLFPPRGGSASIFSSSRVGSGAFGSGAIPAQPMDLSSHLARMNLLNQAVALATQLYKDVNGLQNHKYLAHQVALLYVRSHLPLLSINLTFSHPHPSVFLSRQLTENPAFARVAIPIPPLHHPPRPHLHTPAIPYPREFRCDQAAMFRERLGVRWNRHRRSRWTGTFPRTCGMVALPRLLIVGIGLANLGFRRFCQAFGVVQRYLAIPPL